jgi:hypothetical protein
LVKLTEWERIIQLLRNSAKNIGEDVIDASDEVKAIGELFILRHDITDFLNTICKKPGCSGRKRALRAEGT